MAHPLSNAPAGYPDLSPGGFPLVYPMMPDPADENWPKRSIPVPGMAPRLYHASQTFASDADVFAYIQRVMEPSPVVGGTPWGEVRYEGQLGLRQLFQSPASFYLAKKAAERTLSGRGGDLFTLVMYGSNRDVAQVKEWAQLNMPPDFDAATYDGAYKAEIDAAFSA